jgi:hypothetical protein
MKKSDIYTKVVLTVIAVALMKIAFVDMPIVNEAQAQLSRSDISYCWDLATIDKVSERQWQIHTYC